VRACAREDGLTAIPTASGAALVYFHGGGWVLGSVITAHGVCAALAHESRYTVVSVDYRLAPEHPFPAAVEDAWAATTWVHKHGAELGAPGPLAVGGDSAGGNLAAVMALRARDRGLPLAFQLLVYPVMDADLDTTSYPENAQGYWLTRAGMAWFWDQYLPDGDRFHPDASPLRAEDVSGTPPALVITAEYDPLRDEGEAYARRLEEAGVPVTLSRYDGLIHAFHPRPRADRPRTRRPSRSLDGARRRRCTSLNTSRRQEPASGKAVASRVFVSGCGATRGPTRPTERGRNEDAVEAVETADSPAPPSSAETERRSS
jgi:acetyl esterase